MLLDTIIRYVCFGLFFIGLWLLIQPFFTPYYNGVKAKYQRRMKRDVHYSSKLFQSISQLLEVSINKNSMSAVYTFIFVELILWFLVFIGLSTSGFIVLHAFIGSLVMPTLVYVFLKFKVHTNRVTISFEGLMLVQEILNNYKIYHHNLHEAIDQSIVSLGEKAPLSKRMLLNLSYRFREGKSRTEIQEAVDQMVYSMDVSWSKQLANLFKIAITKGLDITQGLEDIATDLAELDQMREKKRQLNIEGNFMLKGLLPLMGVAGFYFIFGVSEFSLWKYLEYQFAHPIGFRMFLVTILMISVSALLYMFFTRTKNDF